MEEARDSRGRPAVEDFLGLVTWPRAWRCRKHLRFEAVMALKTEVSQFHAGLTLPRTVLIGLMIYAVDESATLEKIHDMDTIMTVSVICLCLLGDLPDYVYHHAAAIHDTIGASFSLQ